MRSLSATWSRYTPSRVFRDSDTTRDQAVETVGNSGYNKDKQKKALVLCWSIK